MPVQVDISSFLGGGEDNTYNLSFDLNGGTGEFEPITFSGSSEEKAIPSVKPVRDKADFKEWNTHADGTGASYAPGAMISISKDTTLYALFECTISFNDPYGTNSEEKALLGSTYTFKASETMVEGGMFKHWTGTAGNYETGQSLKIPSHVEFTAYYVATIAYFGIDGSKISESVVKYDSEVKILTPGAIPWKVFLNWNTSADGTGTLYNADATYVAKDINLHAQTRDWNILDSDVGTKFQYNVTGKVLDLSQYQFINDVVNEANNLVKDYTAVSVEAKEAKIVGIYTQEITSINAETSEATYTRTGVLDVTVTIKFNGIDDMGTPQRLILLKILGIEKNTAGEYLKDFTKKDISLTAVDNGFGIAGTGVTKVAEIDLITLDGTPYISTVLDKQVIPVSVAGLGDVDRTSKIILKALDITVSGKVDMSAELSGVEGLPWQTA